MWNIGKMYVIHMETSIHVNVLYTHIWTYCLFLHNSYRNIHTWRFGVDRYEEWNTIESKEKVWRRSLPLRNGFMMAAALEKGQQMADVAAWGRLSRHRWKRAEGQVGSLMSAKRGQARGAPPWRPWRPSWRMWPLGTVWEEGGYQVTAEP